MTYSGGWVNYDSIYFLAALISAQDGDVPSRNWVVVASAPLVYGLYPTADEAQELFIDIIEVALPKWKEIHPWALHCTVVLRSRLATMRRSERRREERGF